MRELLCEHAPCGCEAQEGLRYCGEACETAANDDRAAGECTCGHPQCMRAVPRTGTGTDA